MRFGALAFFVFAAASAARLALAGYASRLDSPALVARAARSVQSAEYARKLAELDPARARGAFDEALAWNPRSSATLIALALDEERSRDFDSAARHLLAAAAVDRQYQPAWTLANFYFRRGERDPFWRWARRAAELSTGDLEPLLTLCDRVDPGHATARLSINQQAEQRKFNRAYLDLLIAQSRWRDAQAIAQELMNARDPDDARRLTAFTTRLIGARQYPAALEIWRGLFPNPGQLVNADFSHPASGEGFDWRTPQTPGIDPSWTPGRLLFRLSGREPENCTLLEQPVPLDPGRYILTFEFTAAGLAPQTGLRWTLDASPTSQLQLTESGAPTQRAFSVAQSGVRWLRLMYLRGSGSTTAEGRIELANLGLNHP